jgi:hypothetical protein
LYQYLNCISATPATRFRRRLPDHLRAAGFHDIDGTDHGEASNFQRAGNRSSLEWFGIGLQPVPCRRRPTRDGSGNANFGSYEATGTVDTKTG